MPLLQLLPVCSSVTELDASGNGLAAGGAGWDAQGGGEARVNGKTPAAERAGDPGLSDPSLHPFCGQFGQHTGPGGQMALDTSFRPPEP